MDLQIIKDVNIVYFDTAGSEAKFLMSYDERNFEVSESVAQFIDILKVCESTADAAARLSSVKNTTYTESDIDTLYEKCIGPLVEDEQIGKKKKSQFLWSRELIPASIVAIFPKYLKFLFQRKTMMALVTLIVIAEALFFYLATTDIHLGQVNVTVIVGVMLLFVCSSVFHEFGHATACSHCGSTPRGIGFGLYINFPVFYSDVSDIWKLSRKDRMLVNFGGVYFQLLFLLPLFAIFFLTENDIIKYFILTINLNFIFTLNPFFKFDGYWIMTDLLGVPNLRARSKEVFKYYWGVIRGKTADNKPFLLTLKKSTKIFFIFYSVVVNLFFLYYFCYVIPRFLIYFVSKFPEMLKQLTTMIAMGHMPPMGLITGIIGQLLVLCLMSYMIYRMAAQLLKNISFRK